MPYKDPNIYNMKGTDVRTTLLSLRTQAYKKKVGLAKYKSNIGHSYGNRRTKSINSLNLQPL